MGVIIPASNAPLKEPLLCSSLGISFGWGACAPPPAADREPVEVDGAVCVRARLIVTDGVFGLISVLYCKSHWVEDVEVIIVELVNEPVSAMDVCVDATSVAEAELVDPLAPALTVSIEELLDKTTPVEVASVAGSE